MASEKDEAFMRDYETSLEDLTFNSKPIINHLTMTAGSHSNLASRIVGLIERRLFQVATRWLLNCLYELCHVCLYVCERKIK